MVTGPAGPLKLARRTETRVAEQGKSRGLREN